MDRIVASVRIDNALDASKRLSCDAFVDTGVLLMVLPEPWKDRLGKLDSTRSIELETATHGTIKGQICGPVRVQLDGFRPIFTELLFADMKTEQCEPLIGNIVLAQSQARIDMLGHRLIHIKHMDLKSYHSHRPSTFAT